MYMSLKNLFEGEKPLMELEQFYESFRLDRLKDLKELRILLEKSDHDLVSQMIHRWKGSCEPYGFAGLLSLSSSLQTNLKERNRKECEIILQSLEDYLNNKKMRS